MLRNIILRELFDHLRSLRLSLTFILVVVVMTTASALYVGDYRQLVADYSENVNANLRLLTEKVEKGFYHVVSFGPNQLIYRSPNTLGLIAEGHEKDQPNAFEVDAFSLAGPQMKLRGNYTLWRFDQLDWVFIVGVILSFAALVLTYDGISGEREAGTLRLCLSNALPRSTLLLGKFIGAIISLVIPLIVGMCMSLLILSISGVAPLDGAHWQRIGVIVLLSILYISFFVALGLFISSLTQTSAVSLILLLLVWVGFVVIIPRTGGLLASELVQLPDAESVSQRAKDATWDVVKRYSGKGSGFSRNWSPGEPLSRSVQVADAQIAIYDEYRNRQINQVRLAQNLTRISPTAIYQIACESLAGSGIKHYERFLGQAREYRRTLLQYTRDKYPYGTDSLPGREELKKLEVNFDDIPKFADKPPDASTAFADAGWNILLLFLFNTVFLMGAFLVFMRYDV